jgi:hypothetical protein
MEVLTLGRQDACPTIKKELPGVFEQLLVDKWRGWSVSISSPWWLVEAHRGRNEDIG